jgi:hypothetical protein
MEGNKGTTMNLKILQLKLKGKLSTHFKSLASYIRNLKNRNTLSIDLTKKTDYQNQIWIFAQCFIVPSS